MDLIVGEASDSEIAAAQADFCVVDAGRGDAQRRLQDPKCFFLGSHFTSRRRDRRFFFSLGSWRFVPRLGRSVIDVPSANTGCPFGIVGATVRCLSISILENRTGGAP